MTNYESQDMETLEDQPSADTDAIQHENLAEDRDKDTLIKIAEQCHAGYQNDLASRSLWEKDLDEWIKLAKQTREPKTYPWPNASNVKYPLLTTAAMQFSARAYPALVPSNGQLVKTKVIGYDPTGDKWEKADRVSKFMSYQILYEMDKWEEDMDKLLMMLPVVGTMFKKTWYNKAEDKICSCVVLPKNLVVNYWAKSLHNVERISERIEMSPRLLKERQNQGIFRKVELGDPVTPPTDANSTPNDETTPHTLIEQHTFYDLDNDGYPEPYIVTFELNSKEILRISRRYDLDDVELDENEKVKKIKPIQMYTKFGFVPNPDGGFYDIGLGVLLGPLNESVNTLINQLVDAGSLSNLQSGFIGKALRLKMGDAKFSPGEWKPVNATGDDLRKQIVPLPAKEPSNVLFELMGALVTSGKELASVAEIFTGKMPGQNTPATTTMATVEQGMKVFTAVYKRIYRSLEEEFKKIYKLNSMYIDPNHYVAVIDEQVGPEDFDLESYDVCPGADPSSVSQSEKLMKAQGLLELVQFAPQAFDIVEVFSRVLEAQEQPNWQKVFNQEVQASGQLPPAPPDPKLMAIQAKVQADQQKAAMDIQFKQQEMELDARDKTMQMQMKQQEHAQKMQHMQESAVVEAKSDIAMANIYASTERMKGQQDLQNSQASHQQQMQQQKEKQQLAQQANAKSGKATPSQGSSKGQSTKSSKSAKKPSPKPSK
jgi:chaperonin GroES